MSEVEGSRGEQLLISFPNPAPLRLQHTDWQSDTHERSLQLYQYASRRWPRSSFPPLQIQFFLRGHSAGTACSQSFIINYNDYLLQKYQQQFIDLIVPHEVAHLVVAARFKRRTKPHGEQWRQVMAAFDANPAVTHDFDSRPARRSRRYLYRCACPDSHPFAGISHRRVRSGWRRYSCRICGQVLKFAGEIEMR